MSNQSRSAAIDRRFPATHPVSPVRSRNVASFLFRKLITNVNRQRLATDRAYYALVSAIAELLCDEEVAALAHYLAPQLAAAAGLRPAREAPEAMRG